MKLNVVRMSILILGIIYIFVIPADPVAIKFIFKLIPMLLIIYYAFKRASEDRTMTHYLILIGLGFSIIADGSIVYWFIAGLVFFLIAHLFYIAAFIQQYHFSRIRASSLILLLIFSGIIGIQLVTSMQESGNQALIIPVIFYILAIMIMCWLAIMTRNIWATIGSILFVISDSILAWDKFVTPIEYEEALIMVTYYAAQFFIAHSLMTLAQTKEKTT